MANCQSDLPSHPNEGEQAVRAGAHARGLEGIRRRARTSKAPTAALAFAVIAALWNLQVTESTRSSRVRIPPSPRDSRESQRRRCRDVAMTEADWSGFQTTRADGCPPKRAARRWTARARWSALVVRAPSRMRLARSTLTSEFPPSPPVPALPLTTTSGTSLKPLAASAFEISIPA